MPANKESIEALFSVGDVFPRISRNEHKLRVAAILEDRILLQPASAENGEIGLEYEVISNTLDDGQQEADPQGPSPLQFFVTEYRRREQISWDDKVDALWDSAGELFLYSPCTPDTPC